MSPRSLRIATLVLPSLLAAVITLRAEPDHLLHSVAPALAALWVFMAGALAMRFLEGRRPCRTGTVPASPWDQLDVLTATGSSMMWFASLALVAAALTGWASLSVVGVLGLGAVYLAASWTAIVAGGEEPWRRATITRTVLPETAVEGDPLREEVRLANVRIPPGMRLFAAGRATWHGAITRYSVGPEGSGADLRLESDLGPAPRGDHKAPPLALWLGDVLGLTRTPMIWRGETAFIVLPKPAAVDNVRQLLGRGGDDAQARPANMLPTEGTFRIREYTPGDDMRRIHWVRSLQANQLVVRLPDEIPHAEPAVRLVLDNELSGTEALATRAADELLDALVHVWLGIGKVLAESGTRVTLVTAVDQRGAITAVERTMLPRTPREALKLGARVAWQDAVPLAKIVERSTQRQIVVSCRPSIARASGDVTWVAVPEIAWTSPEPRLQDKAPVRLPFPSGSAENRRDRRRRDRERIEAMWNDRVTFSQVACWIDWSTLTGAYVARPDGGRVSSGGSRVTLEVVP